MSVERGFLVLADISGCTGYLAETELDHAQEILAELLGEVVAGRPLCRKVVAADAEANLARLRERLGDTPGSEDFAA